MAEQIFDLERAERLLPQLERWLQIIVEGKRKLSEIETEYTHLVESIVLAGGRWVDVAHFSGRKQEKEDWGDRLRNAAQEISSCGCLLKDAELGLVDFPCQIEGREAYLCWKLGEPCIQFWHHTDEGFASRKPIDEKLMAQFKRSRPS